MPTEKTDLKSLSSQRSGSYRKDPKDEEFLDQLNAHLKSFEKEQYQRGLEQEHPIFMVVGAPRSGTTFCTQFLSNAFKLAYINNLEARFFQNPVSAIKLSQQILGNDKLPGFGSHYAKTEGICNIHEFGYFWRHWLKKGSLEAMERITEDEEQIDWSGLKDCLLNMQFVWNKAAVFKNIYGSYHMPRLSKLLPKVVFVYIERDELDVAESIYGARKNYYGEGGMRKWWSYSPPNVMDLLNKNEYQQIAAQVHYLKAYYKSEFTKLNPEHKIHINYQDLSQEPWQIAQNIKEHVLKYFNYALNISEELPKEFTYVSRKSSDSPVRSRLKAELEKLKNQK